MASAPNQPRTFNNQAYLPNGANSSGPTPGATPLLPNQGRVVQQNGARVLCIADIRGNLKSMNDLAAAAKADYIIHTGDFGFYDDLSLDRIAEKTLRHVAQYSPLLSENVKRQIAQSPPQVSVKERFSREQLPLSELPLFLNKQLTLNVPVYTVWGACEDVQVLEKLRSGEYKINNLHIIDEAHSRLLEIGGVKLRLLGLGGAVVMHKLFDNGEGKTTIAGGQGTMWTTLLQMGELVDTANRVYDPTETRVFVTHASPAREGLLNQLSVTLKADFSISAGLHFRYGSSYNEFSVNPTLDYYRGKLAASKASFNDVWETVKAEVEPAVAENEFQQKLLNYAIEIVHKMPSVANGGNPFGAQAPGSGQVDESAFKNLWNFNLADAAFGWLVLDIDNGRIGTEMKAQGFNFAHRGGRVAPSQGQVTPVSATGAPMNAPINPVGGNVSAAPPSQAQRNVQPPPSTQQPQQSQNQAPPRQSGGSSQPYQQTQQQTQQRNASQGNRSGQLPPAAANKDTSRSGPSPQQSNASDKNAATSGAEKATANGPKPNGTTAAGAVTSTTATANATSDKPSDKPDTPSSEKKAPQTLFITSVKDEDEARRIFTEEDKGKIQRFEKLKNNWLAHFSSNEDMQAALSHVSAEYRSGKFNTPWVRVFKEYGSGGGRGASGGDGGSRWQGSGGRGGASGGGGMGSQSGGSFRSGGGQGGGAGSGGSGAGGYRSGGGASDSEGGRGGRGGYRGGRGGPRYERGRGRGGGGGGGDRGGKGGNIEGSNNAASSAPAGGDA